jgi:hypothetical protein
LRGRFEKFDRSDTAPLEHLAEIVNGGNEIAHRLGDVRLEVAASDHAFHNVEIDQDQWPVSESRDARYDWSFELEHDGAGADALQR